MRIGTLKRPVSVRLCALIGCLAMLAAGCSQAPTIPASEQPLSKDTMTMLGRKGMDASAPIFVRIFKEESELEVWKLRSDGRYYHFKTYPICNWSGKLGPKMRIGDKQAPEGFYSITYNQLNPNSKFHLAFNLGFPNAYDKSKHRTGQYLMVHGDCKSAGCYAMTDALIEEIYALSREALRGGQRKFDVHAYPFRMTDEKLYRHRKSKWFRFWRTLKRGYDYFEVNRIPPTIAVCERRYIVDVVLPEGRRLNPTGRCPRFKRQPVSPFAPNPGEYQLAQERITVPGPKTRVFANTAPPSPPPYSTPGLMPELESAPTLTERPASWPSANALGYNDKPR